MNDGRRGESESIVCATLQEQKAKWQMGARTCAVARSEAHEAECDFFVLLLKLSSSELRCEKVKVSSTRERECLLGSTQRSNEENEERNERAKGR